MTPFALQKFNPKQAFPTLSGCSLGRNLSIQTTLEGGPGFIRPEVALSFGIDKIRLRINSDKIPHAINISEYKSHLVSRGILLPSAVLVFPKCNYSSIDLASKTVGFIPKETQAERIFAFQRTAEVLGKAGIPLITCHFGQIPIDPKDRAAAIEIALTLRGICHSNGIKLALEIGQDSAKTMLSFLREVNNDGNNTIGVNFDIANPYLYDEGSSIYAWTLLRPYILGIDLKDAEHPKASGKIGQTKVIGEGIVPWVGLLPLMQEHNCPVLLEQNFGGEENAHPLNLASCLASLESKLQIAKKCKVAEERMFRDLQSASPLFNTDLLEEFLKSAISRDNDTYIKNLGATGVKLIYSDSNARITHLGLTGEYTLIALAGEFDSDKAIGDHRAPSKYCCVNIAAENNTAIQISNGTTILAIPAQQSHQILKKHWSSIAISLNAPNSNVNHIYLEGNEALHEKDRKEAGSSLEGNITAQFEIPLAPKNEWSLEDHRKE